MVASNRINEVGIDIFHGSIHGDKAQGTRNQTLHGLGRVFCRWFLFGGGSKSPMKHGKKHISFQLGDKGMIFWGVIKPSKETCCKHRKSMSAQRKSVTRWAQTPVI